VRCRKACLDLAETHGDGGQYTHAAIWVLWAPAELGDVERAVDLFQRLLPIRHALTREAAARYRTEPYVLAADVYSAPAWTGRGGWTWYTGAAAWAYRLGQEAILGVRPSRGAWRLDPHIPARWPELEVILRDGATVVRIVVENPRGVNSGVERMLLDGKPIEPPILPRLKDGRTHEVLAGVLRLMRGCEVRANGHGRAPVRAPMCRIP